VEERVKRRERKKKKKRKKEEENRERKKKTKKKKEKREKQTYQALVATLEGQTPLSGCFSGRYSTIAIDSQRTIGCWSCLLGEDKVEIEMS
jgi:hypothetical protein